MSIVDITTKRKQQIQTAEEIKQKSEHIKFMTVQAVLNAFEVMGLTEVDRGYLWFHNTLNSAIMTFFEQSIGEMNIPPEIKIEAEARIKEKKEKLKKSKAVKVNQEKTAKEARAMIIKIGAKKRTKQKIKNSANAPTLTEPRR